MPIGKWCQGCRSRCWPVVVRLASLLRSAQFRSYTAPGRVLRPLWYWLPLDRLEPLYADHVVGVGVVAQEFDGITGEGRRVAVLSRPTGQEPGPFAVELLQQELQLLRGTNDQSRWHLVGSAYIITAIPTGKEHPRRREFGDTTDGVVKGVGLPEKAYLIAAVPFAVSFLVSLGFAIRESFRSPVDRFRLLVLWGAVGVSAIVFAICMGEYTMGK